MILPEDVPESLPDPEDQWDERFAGLRPEMIGFLLGLEQGLTVAESASIAGIPLAALYRWRREDRAFAEAWTAVDEFIVDAQIEDTAIQLSIHGASKPIYYKGMPVVDANGHPAVVREYPIPLIIFMLKTRPSLRERYQEKAAQVEVSFAERLRATIADIDRSVGAMPGPS